MGLQFAELPLHASNVVLHISTAILAAAQLAQLGCRGLLQQQQERDLLELKGSCWQQSRSAVVNLPRHRRPP